MVNKAIATKAAVTAKQERLLELILSTGQKPNAVFAEAGYANAAGAYKAWRAEHVQERFRQLIHERLGSDVALALNVRQSLLSARSEKVRLDAVVDVLDRAGFKPPERHAHLVTGNISVSIDLSE